MHIFAPGICLLQLNQSNETMSNKVTERYLECYNELIAKKKVKNGRQFSLSLNYAPQSWSKIQNSERQVTVDLIRKAVIK